MNISNLELDSRPTCGLVKMDLLRKRESIEPPSLGIIHKQNISYVVVRALFTL